VDESVPADRSGSLGLRHRRTGGRGKRLAPYLLGLPAMVWLLMLFIVPLAIMLSLTLKTCNPASGACSMTWNWGELPHEVDLYHAQFITSFVYAGAATVIDLAISFPIAYWIAFYGGRKKNFFLMMLLVPFFVSFVIRTLVWQFILANNGFLFGFLRDHHLVSSSFHVLGTGYAVIAGLAYNYLPFTALPLYVAIERIDRRVLDAAHDLYANHIAAFTRVVLPLAIPGIFAAFLLTFIPAFGDYVNQELLGGASSTMIGTVIQDSFLVSGDYAGGSALSLVLLVVSLIGIWLYARVLGSRSIEEYL
jgi:spermidine/putrescine transport system permease protein